jgi:hypothetical protein
MPPGLIDEQDRMGVWRDHLGDLRKMQVHRLGVAGRQDQGCALAFSRADGAEDVGRGGALIAGRARPRTTLGPPAGDLVLLADPRLVREPDLYGAAIACLAARDLLQAGAEAFLKPSITPAA